MDARAERKEVSEESIALTDCIKELTAAVYYLAERLNNEVDRDTNDDELPTMDMSGKRIAL